MFRTRTSSSPIISRGLRGIASLAVVGAAIGLPLVATAGVAGADPSDQAPTDISATANVDGSVTVSYTVPDGNTSPEYFATPVGVATSNCPEPSGSLLISGPNGGYEGNLVSQGTTITVPSDYFTSGCSYDFVVTPQAPSFSYNSSPPALTITDANQSAPSNEVTIGAPTITSAASATFTAGSAGSFTVTSTGNPMAALSETGALPDGVTFLDDGDGTATLSGTATGSGSFPITITADNGDGSPADQSFALTVNPAPVAPAITSPASTTFTAGSAGSFTMTSTGNPTPALSAIGTLPSGVTFVDNGDGTGTLAGTPAAGSGGTYIVILGATNGTGSPASETFTLTVDASPIFTSATSATFIEGAGGTFTVTASGFPTVNITQSGTLPPGVTFSNGVLSGTPTATGSFPLNLTAVNGIGHNVAQNFTLLVDAAPQFTSASSHVFNEGVTNAFTVTTTGFPAPTVTESGALPAGVTLSHGVLSGTPTATGSFPITFTATNGVGSPATQSFTLTVYSFHVTTTSLPTLTQGTAYSVQLGAAGGTAPYKWKKLAKLPKGLRLSRSGLLSGTVTAKDVGTGVQDIAVEVTDSTLHAKQTASVSLSLTIAS